jgi:hypothetical protein
LPVTAFGNYGYPRAIKSIREEKNSLTLRQFFFVFRINFILFGGTQREDINQDQKQSIRANPTCEPKWGLSAIKKGDA